MIKDVPLVSVCTLAYNHEPYIRECLEGILMQKTDFAFELLIHDDASTDATADIIREYEAKYPDIVKPIYQTENQHSKKVRINSTYNFPRVQGKYIAMCEGDDYWIDPLKLQKQVDFMEANPEYGMCCTATKTLHLDKSFSVKLPKKSEIGVNDIMVKNSIATLNVLFRTNLIFEYIDSVKPQQRNWRMGDYPIWIWISLNHKIKHLSDVTSVYRIVDGSASHSKDKNKNLQFILNTIDIRKYFKDNYDIAEKIYLKGLAFAYKQSVNVAIDLDRWDVIESYIDVLKKLSKWGKYIKMNIYLLLRNNKKALAVVRKFI